MIQDYIENANFEDTGFHYALSLISGKHKMVILYCLMEYRVVRFNELKRYLKKNIRQNPQYKPQRTGSRQFDHKNRISPNPSKGRI